MSNESKSVGLDHKDVDQDTASLKKTTKQSTSLSSRLVVIILLCLLGGFLSWYFVMKNGTTLVNSNKKSKSSNSVMVVTAVAKKGDVGIYIDALGTITPLTTVNVKSRIDGQLMKILYHEGQEVKKGDLLVELDSRAYQILLHQAQGQLIKDKALLENAKIDLQRYVDLYQKESISKQVLDTQRALVHEYEGEIKIDQATIDNSLLQIEYCNIKAPISGMVGLRLVDLGNMVRASDTTSIAVITQVSPISALFAITEDNVPLVMKRFKSKKEISIDVYDRSDTNKIGSGILLSMDNQIDTSTGTLKLRALIDNEDRMLIPNQFVNIHLLLETKRDAVLIPIAAVQQGINGSFVYLVKPDLTVIARDLQTGAVKGMDILVKSGLKVGDMVVTDGVDMLKIGSKVTLVNADAPLAKEPKASKQTQQKPQ